VNRTLRVAALAAAIVGVDQLVKAWVRGALDRGEVREVIPGVLDLTNTRNTGVAFGLFAGSGGLVVGLVTVVALGALVWVYVANRHKPYVWLPTGMLIGGALGNLIDRVFRDDGVTDFADIPVLPPFNVADVMITFGVVILVFALEQRERPD
jgi:signal peptidase II